MSHQTPKPCGPQIVHPRAIANVPGLARIAYRVGDFPSFRDALLRPLETEVDLRDNWKPGPDDLGLQLVEWVAYLADVLTFYGEQWMQGAYLRTAEHDEQVRRLVRLLGYRPRPAIASLGRLAADVTAPITLPKGFAFQSKPGPGEEPQLFELDAETKLSPPSATVALPPPDGSFLDEGGTTVWVRSAVNNVKVGDSLFVAPRTGPVTTNWAWAEVAALEPDQDAFGKPATRVRFSSKLTLTGSPTDFQLVRSTQTSQAWPYGVAGDSEAIGEKTVHLAAMARDIRPGDRVLLDASQARDLGLHERAGASILDTGTDTLEFTIETGPKGNVDVHIEMIAPTTSLFRATSVSEHVWFANGQDKDPTKAPADENVPAVPVLHTVLTFDRTIGGKLRDAYRHQLSFRHGWREVGDLIAPPVRSVSTIPGTLASVGAGGFPTGFAGPVLIEGADGKGVAATLTVQPANKASVTDAAIPAEKLATPLKVWTTLLAVSRGQTVEREVLGSGDARVLGQEFVLQKKPLTYLPKAEDEMDRLYSSTLRVWVDGVQWKEVSHFHGQAETARVYVTHEDDAGKTHVRFATRLPTGANNVVAAYRHGGGAADPAAGSLTMILKPRDGLRGVRNPVPVGGGADPEPADNMRRYAPRSVLTFDRAVSVDDYEAIAAQAPSVTRARAYWQYDPKAQRGLVKVYVGDDQEAVDSANAALKAACDPNRPALVELATPIVMLLALSVKVAPEHAAENVLPKVRAALLDADTGLFGSQSSRIGRPLFDSELSAACLVVPGVQAVQLVKFESVATAVSFTSSPPPLKELPPCAGHRHDPGEGKFFTLTTESLVLTVETGHGA